MWWPSFVGLPNILSNSLASTAPRSAIPRLRDFFGLAFPRGAAGTWKLEENWFTWIGGSWDTWLVEYSCWYWIFRRFGCVVWMCHCFLQPFFICQPWTLGSWNMPECQCVLNQGHLQISRSSSYLISFYLFNVNPGLITPLPPPYIRRSRRFSIDFSVTNPPQIKRHLGLRKTGHLFPTTQQEDYFDWPISKWGALIGGICCIPLLTRGEICTNTKNHKKPGLRQKGAVQLWG